jgi:outer membrane protein TolC
MSKRPSRCLGLVVAALLLAARPGLAEPQRLTLQDCERLALQRNLGLVAAQKGIRAAEEGVNASRAYALPTIEAQGAYMRLGPEVSLEVPTPGGPQKVVVSRGESKTATLSLSQILFSSGRVESGIEAAKKSLAGMRAAFDDSVDQVLFSTRESFYNALRAKALEAAAEESVRQASEHVRVARARFQAATVPQVEVMRAEVELADAQYRLSQAKQGRELALITLRNVMNAPPDQEMELVEEGPPKPATCSLEECLTWAQAHRKDLMALRQQIEAVRAGAKAAGAGALPAVMLTGKETWQQKTAFSSDRSWSVVVGLSVPIFDGLLARSQAHQLDRQAEQLLAQAEQLAQGIDAQVRSAHLSMRTAEEQLAAANEARKQAKEVMRIAQLRYEAGVAASYEVIDAETALAGAEANYANALYDLHIAQARLARAAAAYSARELERPNPEE